MNIFLPQCLPSLTFILTVFREYLHSSVCMWYELVLLKSNGKMLMKWLSEQFWGCCSCMSSFSETADAEVTASVTRFSLCVVNNSARYIEQTSYAFESLSRMSNTDRSEHSSAGSLLYIKGSEIDIKNYNTGNSKTNKKHILKSRQ